jgi:putative restriction endonuclease
VKNGILLRSDLHKLFDIGYLTVTPNLRVEVSKRIKEEYENGREYYAHHGRQLIVLPQSVKERPSREFLEWHNQSVFVS